jgi:hypothetical protein
VKRHWKLWTGLGVLLLFSLGIWAVLLATREPEPVRAYDRLKVGMTLPEVEQAIGMPAGDYRTRPPTMMITVGSSLKVTMIPIDEAPVGWDIESWQWDEYSISVFVDTEGHVTGYFLDGEPEPPGFFDRVRTFLGL